MHIFIKPKEMLVPVRLSPGLHLHQYNKQLLLLLLMAFPFSGVATANHCFPF